MLIAIALASNRHHNRHKIVILSFKVISLNIYLEQCRWEMYFNLSIFMQINASDLMLSFTILPR